MWQQLLIGLGLVLVIEGILPALNPRGFRQAMLMVAQLDERALRIFGVVSMAVGAVLIYWLTGAAN
ncbi:MAG TPA: DUF2065 domain-containing protein [Gammaproteobacteria bacterium]|nr:DUF2065 domain-containing protein [Gammaproteobacteria bacterium]